MAPMSEPWIPHGLITKPQYEFVYKEAMITTDEHGHLVLPDKCKSIHLFEDILNRVLFVGKPYFSSTHSCELPKSQKRDRRRCL